MSRASLSTNPSIFTNSPSCHSAPECPVSCASQISSCPRVTGNARSPNSVQPPSRTVSRSGPPALCQPLAQTLRPYIGPILFDVFQTRSAVRFAVNHLPAGWNVGEGRPQAVLFLVVYQDEKTAIVVVKRIDAHRFSRPSG